jgi:hypothetical protein
MVLNRMMKGSKEIDIAATLEHIRDQRSGKIFLLCYFFLAFDRFSFLFQKILDSGFSLMDYFLTLPDG